jgi:hypothetical protein
MSDKDRSMTDTARLNKISLNNGDIQMFVYKWDEMISIMKNKPTDEDLMNLFVLQFDLHLPKNHEFYVEWLLWYNKPAGDAVRTYQGIWSLCHDWIRRKRDTKNRKEALKDHIPGLAGGTGGNTQKALTGKGGTSSDKICFTWKNIGKCADYPTGTCKWEHPKSAKGIGKANGSDGNGAKGDAKGKSSKSKAKGQPGNGKGRSASPKARPVVTDVKQLCKLYLKGECKNGAKCKYHHNEPCRFHAAGKCTKGADCVFPHWNVKPITAAAAAAQSASAPKAGPDENA